ncbi:HNH endonuclease signature motif containing protein [Bacteroides heparinolyticus]|uniref:HNH endonuclease signature motif containing protein n=1 Tax=Prevotella heparinolytica TaxID=28113 RepID=UPI003C6C48FC
MERTSKINKRRCAVPMQIFNGKAYHRYAGERYFTRGTHKMHRDVWEYYHGAIPKGYHVHHIDEDTSHNDISNLELLEEHEHLRMHEAEKQQDPQYRELQIQRMDYAREFANKWHGSEAGHEWHVKHGKEVVANLNPKTFICEYCGKEYETFPTGQHHFCSNKCKTAYRYHSGVDNEVRICKECGKEFIANKYSSTQYCSRRCSGRASARARYSRNRDNE